jgi:7-keto-8-aminopelargonate synthetase-like enzyme
LLLDESFSFGMLGKTGRGVTEYFNIPVRHSSTRRKTFLVLHDMDRSSTEATTAVQSIRH